MRISTSRPVGHYARHSTFRHKSFEESKSRSKNLGRIKFQIKLLDTQMSRFNVIAPEQWEVNVCLPLWLKNAELNLKQHSVLSRFQWTLTPKKSEIFSTPVSENLNIYFFFWISNFYISHPKIRRVDIEKKTHPENKVQKRERHIGKVGWKMIIYNYILHASFSVF